jgi:hypothetical protein
VLRGEDHEGRAEQRVRAGREDADLVAARLVVVRRRREDDLGALGPPDPVRLHDPDRIRELNPAEVEQLVGVLRDAEVPLLELALLDPGSASPAAAIGALDLLAGERAVVGAPVDLGLRAVGEPGLEELQEEPLVPAVVVGVGGDDLGLPVERGAHPPQLAAHVRDVRHRPVARVDVVADRGVLGGQPEGIESDRQEDVLAMHAVEARDRVGRGLDVPVTDVDVARRVRVHRQQVEPLSRVLEVRPVEPDLVPRLLPARLDLGRLVALDPRAFGSVGSGRHARSLIRRTPRRRRGVRSCFSALSGG